MRGEGEGGGESMDIHLRNHMTVIFLLFVILYYHLSVIKETAMFFTAGIVVSAFGKLQYIKKENEIFAIIYQLN